MHILVSILILLLLAYGGGQWAWHRRTAGLLDELATARRVAEPAMVSLSGLDTLPPPVARYLRLVFGEGADAVPVIRDVELRHTGTFNLGGKWLPFTSVQHVTTARPGFVWDARVRMMPGLVAHVHDAYVNGRGDLTARVGGLIPVMHMEGADIDDGEFLRWCAESAWYPTVLLPACGAEWKPRSDTSAELTLRDGDRSATLTATFGPDGLLNTIRVEKRGRAVDGVIIPTPWEGRWERYERRNGVLVPTKGEVAWITENGYEPYWRGEAR
jgi:hypothetical protein